MAKEKAEDLELALQACQDEKASLECDYKVLDRKARVERQALTALYAEVAVLRDGLLEMWNSSSLALYLILAKAAQRALDRVPDGKLKEGDQYAGSEKEMDDGKADG